jgi:antitoxin (DNA-binding transcriptional repressor) of toxin-antitoxin stability system
MEEVKTVGIKALKDQLSAYIRNVKTGQVILVTDRGNVVAEIHSPARKRFISSDESTKSQWISKGKLTASRLHKRECQASPIKLKNGTAAALLNQERAE